MVGLNSFLLILPTSPVPLRGAKRAAVAALGRGVVVLGRGVLLDLERGLLLELGLSDMA